MVLRVAATRATISNTSRIAGEAPTICGARQPGRIAARSPAGPGLARDSRLVIALSVLLDRLLTIDLVYWLLVPLGLGSRWIGP